MRRSPINGTRSRPIVYLNSDGEEIEEEENDSENFDRSNDDHQLSFIDNLFNERRLVFDMNHRYAESLIRERIDTLERENFRLQTDYRRLLSRLNR